MGELPIIILMSWLAGFAAFFGGFLSKIEGSAETEAKRDLIHGIMAFGGGILVAAIAFALIPEAMAVLPLGWLSLTFCLGGVVFCLLDAAISRSGGSRAQFMAMLLDFVPEAIALGALFAHSHSTGILLALMIGAQNLPEGFNAYRETVGSGVAPRRSLRALLAVSFLGPVSALCGYLLLGNRPTVTAGIMSIAAGGILYLVFQDIAPQAKLNRHWAPSLGAVLGFMVGMASKVLVG